MRCLENSNRCQRLTYKMMADNSDRNISLCTEIRDGSWSSWTEVEECRGLEKVEGLRKYRCGEGYKTSERTCNRTLGGKFCQINGEEYRGILERRSVSCHSGDCPGESSLMEMNYNYKMYFSSENIGRLRCQQRTEEFCKTSSKAGK